MAEKMSIVVNVDVEFWAYVKYCYAAFLRKTAWFVLLVFVAVISFHLYNQFRGINESVRFVLISFAAVCLLFMAYVFRLIKKDWKNSAELFKDSRYSFSPDEIEVKRGALETTLNWVTIRKAEEIAGILVVYPTQIRAFLLPWSCFNSESERSELKDLLREKLSDKAKLRK